MKNLEKPQIKSLAQELSEMEEIDPRQEMPKYRLQAMKEQYKGLVINLLKLDAGPYDDEKTYLESVKRSTEERKKEREKIYAEMNAIREKVEQIAIEDFNRADLVEKMRMKYPATDLINELLGEKEVTMDPATGKEFDPNQFEEEK